MGEIFLVCLKATGLGGPPSHSVSGYSRRLPRG